MPPAKGYTEMKDSGIEWLGKIPNNWRTIRVKYAFRIKKEIAGELGHTVLSVTQRGIKPKDMSEKGQFSLDYSKYQLVSSGDFIMNHMDLLTGWVDISNMDGVTSPDYRVFQSSNPEKYYPDFYRYVFQTCYQQRIFYGLGQGVSGFGRWRLPAEIFLNFYLPVPPYESQSAIAAYLDTQCAKIDEIIAQAKASIEDYKQWKASIIYKAVTKGLDPNVEMKDSGIPWIGKVPTHWRVTKIKNFVSIRSGITLGKQYPPGTQLVSRPYLRVANVKAEYVDLQDVATIMVTSEEAEKYALKSGELLMTEGGDRDKLGRGTIWHGEIPGCLHQNHVFAVQVNEKYMLTKFLDYLTASPVGREYFDLTAKKTTNLASTNSTTILQFSVSIPPLTEQEKIIAILDRNTATINEVIAEKETLVSDLESYKKSLIYEVVTGKRQVC